MLLRILTIPWKKHTLAGAARGEPDTKQTGLGPAWAFPDGLPAPHPPHSPGPTVTSSEAPVTWLQLLAGWSCVALGLLVTGMDP